MFGKSSAIRTEKPNTCCKMYQSVKNIVSFLTSLLKIESPLLIIAIIKLKRVLNTGC